MRQTKLYTAVIEISHKKEVSSRATAVVSTLSRGNSFRLRVRATSPPYTMTLFDQLVARWRHPLPVGERRGRM